MLSVPKSVYGIIRQLAAIAAALAVMQATYFLLVKMAEFALGSKWFEVHPLVSVFAVLTVVLGATAWAVVGRSPRRWELLAFRPGLQFLTFLSTVLVLSGVAAFAAMGLGVSISVPDFRIWTAPALIRLAEIFLDAFQEEVFYRYFVFGVFAALTRSMPLALLGSAINFMLMHLNNHLSIFSAGLCLGGMALRSNSIWVSTAAHFAINLFIEIALFSGVISSPPVLSSLVASRLHAVLPWVALPIALVFLWAPIQRDPAVGWMLMQLRRPLRRFVEI